MLMTFIGQLDEEIVSQTHFGGFGKQGEGENDNDGDQV
jgi:hypothetical protein